MDCKQFLNTAFILWDKEIIPTEVLLQHVVQLCYPNTTLMLEAVEHVHLMDAEMCPMEELDDE